MAPFRSRLLQCTYRPLLSILDPYMLGGLKGPAASALSKAQVMLMLLAFFGKLPRLRLLKSLELPR